MITIEELLANPVAFHQSAISVSGVFFMGREHCALYPSSEDTRSPEKGIWLASPEVAAPGMNVLKTLNQKTVRVSGIFISKSKRGAGHFNNWLAEIRGITEITEVAA